MVAKTCKKPILILVEGKSYARYVGHVQTNQIEADRYLLPMEIEAFRRSPSMFYDLTDTPTGPRAA